LNYTPAIQQYIDMKKQYADCILFFRMGDFYETFFEDAKLCSKLLDIILTSKNKNSEHSIPMAGIPFHSVEKYIPKLISHGYKVAIAEQTTDPVPGKIVERQVVSIITPWTYIQESSPNFNYMLAIYFQPHKDGNDYHIARWDFSIGEYQTKSFSDQAQMQKFILNIRPSEIIFDVDFTTKDEIIIPIQQYLDCLVSVYEVPFDAEKFLINICNIQSISSFGKALEDWRLGAITLLLNYIKNTQQKNLSNISRIGLHSNEKYILLDDITIKNLEIFTSSYEWSEKYSLVWIFDNSRTHGWSRLIRNILSNPINDLTQINWRLNNIGHYLSSETNLNLAKKIHNILYNILDIPKLLSNILYKKISPIYFIKLRSTLRRFLQWKGINNFYKNLDFESVMLDELTRLGLPSQTLTVINSLYSDLEKLLKSDDEVEEDMNFIRDGYDEAVDQLRKIAYHSDDLLLQYQKILSDQTWINNVKLKFVMNQWYFIEITNKDISQFEEKLKPVNSDEKFNLIRRNTLKGWQRYVSTYLDTIQTKVLEAKDQLSKLEFQLLEKTKEKVWSISSSLNQFADRISRLDLFTSQAILSKEKKYWKPELFIGEGIEIIGGRHPVIQEYLPQDQQFIPNDLNMKTHESNSHLHIITWPNMWGKSTYLRQNALIILLAHCWLFVPAKQAKIWIVDGIFARVGSGDIIAKNQSTFLTEMIEVANILNNATHKSFVIFDELGRGTSTYDGLALTKAILEYITTQIKAKTLIATHYHELISLEWQLDGVRNFSVSVYETDKQVVFMKKIVPGWANKSYGLDVAKIAWIPNSIIDRAKQNLEHLENWKDNKHSGKLPLYSQATFNTWNYEKIKSILESFDINNLTPLQALQLLFKIKDEI